LQLRTLRERNHGFKDTVALTSAMGWVHDRHRSICKLGGGATRATSLIYVARSRLNVCISTYKSQWISWRLS
jgi:hypothetical protein